MRWKITSIVLAVLLTAGSVVGGLTLAGLTEQLNKLDFNYNLLKEDYNLLKEELRIADDKIHKLKAITPPFHYYPRSRDQYTVIHYISEPSLWTITEPAVVISFPDGEENFVWTRVLGTGSMQPFFGGGARVLGTLDFTPADIAVGDIVSWRDPAGGSVIHQVIEVLPKGVITRGFNNLVDDGLIPWERIEVLWVAVIF
jgi:hypothetical protein